MKTKNRKKMKTRKVIFYAIQPYYPENLTLVVCVTPKCYNMWHNGIPILKSGIGIIYHSKMEPEITQMIMPEAGKTTYFDANNKMFVHRLIEYNNETKKSIGA